jgi:hypothetical protein
MHEALGCTDEADPACMIPMANPTLKSGDYHSSQARLSSFGLSLFLQLQNMYA